MRQGGSEQEFMFLLSWLLVTHTLCLFSFKFLGPFPIMVTIHLTDDRRPAKDGV